MQDYFEELLGFVEKRYIKKVFRCEKKENCFSINNLGASEAVKNIYKKYETFELIWGDGKNHIGGFNYVSCDRLAQENKNIVEIMHENYDIDTDPYSIKESIENWFPLFYFCNGDAFCLDKRSGKVFFYEHDMYDGGPVINGTLIAESIDDLFEKWSYIHFADVYYWDEVVNENGIDLSKEYLKKYL